MNSKTIIIGLTLGVALLLYLWGGWQRIPILGNLTAKPEQNVTPISAQHEQEQQPASPMPQHVTAASQSVVGIAIAEKSEKEMTEEERAVKHELEKDITAAFPTHRMVFDKTKIMTGWLLEDKPDQVLFTESYSGTGSLAMKIKRARVNSIEVITNAAPVITYRDVRFKMEFPKLNFFKRPPYTIMTDESYFKMEYIVRALQILHSEFLSSFGPLISTELRRRQDIQVLSFSKHEDFKKLVPEDLAGLYVPREDRLIVFNQQDSDWTKQALSRVKAEEARHKSSVGNEEQARRLGEWRAGTENSIAFRAKMHTLKTIRHEGAHQLSFSFGTLGMNAPMWLAEGLATYSETEHVGERNLDRIPDLKNSLTAAKTIPVESVLSMREVSPAAYSKYWGLTYFLIQSPMRNRFFEYMRYIREPANCGEVNGGDQLGLLCRFLKITPDDLKKQWKSYLSKL